MNLLYNHYFSQQQLDSFLDWVFARDASLTKNNYTKSDLTALYGYYDNNGNLAYFKPRFDNSANGKWIKPFHITNQGNWAFGEPKDRYNANQIPLYNLPLLANVARGDVVYFVEGEKCADAMATLGIVSVTSGASSSISTTDLTPLQPFHVRLWRDYDLAGEKWQTALMQALDAHNIAYDVIDIDALNQSFGGRLPSGFDSADYIYHPLFDELSGDKIAQKVKSLPVLNLQAFTNQQSTEDLERYTQEPILSPSDAQTQAKQDAWGEIIAMPTGDSDETPFPIQVFGEELKQVIEKIAYYRQVPLSLAGFAVLSAISYVGQAFIDAPMFNGGYIPASLYLMVQAESGVGKSEAVKLAYYSINQYITQAYQDYVQGLADYESQWANSTKQERQRMTREDYKPRNPINVFTGGTVQKLMQGFVEKNYKNASFTADEAGNFFGGASMKSQTASSSIGQLCDIYSSGRAERTVIKNENTTHAYDCRLSMFLSGQSSVIEEAFEDLKLSNQGLLPRCLFAVPNDIRGSRQLITENAYEDVVLMHFWDSLANKLEQPEPQHRFKMAWSATALEYATSYWHKVEQRYNTEQVREYYKFNSRLVENACRVSALLAWYRGKSAIELCDIQAGVALAEYSYQEVKRYSDVNIDTSNAQKLLTWLIKKAKESKQDKTILLSSVQNNCPRPMKNNTMLLNPVLEWLNDANYISIYEVESYRKAKRVIEINPKLLNGQYKHNQS